MNARPEPAVGPHVLGAVNRESTPSIIARKLRDAISSGVFPQGTQLVEADLAAELRVSRGPLREAMQRLTQEKLLDSVRNRGLFVITLTPDDVRDIYFARMSIERAAARAVMARESLDEALSAMRARLAELAAAKDDADAASDADLGFHEQLVELAQSPRLDRMHVTLLTETRMCLTALGRSYNSVDRHRLEEHAAIVDAIAARDEAEVDRLLQAHAGDALARLIPVPD